MAPIPDAVIKDLLTTLSTVHLMRAAMEYEPKKNEISDKVNGDIAAIVVGSLGFILYNFIKHAPKVPSYIRIFRCRLSSARIDDIPLVATTQPEGLRFTSSDDESSRHARDAGINDVDPVRTPIVPASQPRQLPPVYGSWSSGMPRRTAAWEIIADPGQPRAFLVPPKYSTLL